jgi:hypothetical protein
MPGVIRYLALLCLTGFMARGAGGTPQFRLCWELDPEGPTSKIRPALTAAFARELDSDAGKKLSIDSEIWLDLKTSDECSKRPANHQGKLSIVINYIGPSTYSMTLSSLDLDPDSLAAVTFLSSELSYFDNDNSDAAGRLLKDFVRDMRNALARALKNARFKVYQDFLKTLTNFSIEPNCYAGSGAVPCLELPFTYSDYFVLAGARLSLHAEWTQNNTPRRVLTLPLTVISDYCTEKDNLAGRAAPNASIGLFNVKPSVAKLELTYFPGTAGLSDCERLTAAQWQSLQANMLSAAVPAPGAQP